MNVIAKRENHSLQTIDERESSSVAREAADFSPQRLILIGGKGFIGEYLTQILLKGNHQVVVVDKDSSLNKTKDFQAEEVVIMTQPNRQILDDVISFVKKSKGIKKIVYLSTLLLYSDSKFMQDEEVKVDPKTEYEKDKYFEEKLLIKKAKKLEFKLCIVRLSNVYGDTKNKGIINKLLVALIRNEELTIYRQSLTNIRDYIFIEDAVNLLEFLIFFKQRKQIEIFNICIGKGNNLKQLIMKLEKIARKRINFKVDDSLPEKISNIGNNEKILNLSNYKIKFSLTKGLKKTYENYLKHGV